MDPERVDAVAHAVAAALKAGDREQLHQRLSELGVRGLEVFEALQDVQRLELEDTSEVEGLLRLAAELLGEEDRA